MAEICLAGSLSDSPTDLANLAFAFAFAKTEEPALFEAIGLKALEVANKFEGRDLAFLINAFTSQDVWLSHGPLLAALATHAEGFAARYAAGHLAAVAKAFAVRLRGVGFVSMRKARKWD